MEDKEEVKQETSAASRLSPTNNRNKLGSSNSNNKNKKEPAFSGYLQDHKSNPLH
jgi:hypothetical protein